MVGKVVARIVMKFKLYVFVVCKRNMLFVAMMSSNVGAVDVVS